MRVKKDIINVIYQTFSPYIKINKKNFFIENNKFNKELIQFRKMYPKNLVFLNLIQS